MRSRRVPVRMRARTPACVAALAGASAAALAGWVGWVEPRRLVVRRIELELPLWPQRLDGLRVGVLSDLHAGGPHVGVARVAEVVRVLNAQRADLVVGLGDYVDEHVLFGGAIDVGAVAAALGELRAPRGVFAVLGNHDWRNAGRDMGAALADAGIVVLENSGADAGGVWVAGLADSSERVPDVGLAMRGAEDGAPVIALTHDPDTWADLGAGVALTLAGHTHGGQLAIPWLADRVIHSEHGGRYARGVIAEGDRRLFVTTGIGESGYPVRALAAPEVAVLTLRAAGAGAPGANTPSGS